GGANLTPGGAAAAPKPDFPVSRGHQYDNFTTGRPALAVGMGLGAEAASRMPARLELVESQALGILGRNQRRPPCQRPGNVQAGVVPAQTALQLGGVIIGGLVEKFG